MQKCHKNHIQGVKICVYYANANAYASMHGNMVIGVPVYRKTCNQFTEESQWLLRIEDSPSWWRGEHESSQPTWPSWGMPSSWRLQCRRTPKMTWNHISRVHFRVCARPPLLSCTALEQLMPRIHRRLDWIEAKNERIVPQESGHLQLHCSTQW